MVINKHGSFYLRDGWATKILTSISVDRHIFSPSNELIAIDTLGVGKIMVKSLRYWANTSGLTTEKKSPKGIENTPTELFDVLIRNDKYFLNSSSKVFLHRNIVRNVEDSTAIYWLFNVYDRKTISKDEFTMGLYTYLAEHGCNYSKDMVSKEWGCVTNMYSEKRAFNINKMLEDENTSMLSALKLVRPTVNSNVYEKVKFNLNEISPYTLLYCILEDNKGKTQIAIDTLVEDEGQIGKYLNLGYSDIIEALQTLENERYLTVTNNHGSRYIDIIPTDENLLEKIYT